MKTFLFFIILGFIHTVFCNQDLNITNDDLYSLCPVKFFRRKRAFAEYTRWRANQETTPEFIVKVLDEDLPTITPIKTIFAVNIQPVTKGNEKIIIGGAMIPSQTIPQLTTESIRDYTRFVPPTTVTALSTAVSPVEGDLYQLPKIPNNIVPERAMYGPNLHSQRDDSPPSGPQFIARTPSLLPRQYAPIVPVAFTHRTTLGPLTPPVASLIDTIFISPPTRTSPIPEVMWPTRTKSDIEDFRRFQGYGEDTIHPETLDVTRTTSNEQHIPERTSPVPFTYTTEKEYDPMSYLNKFIEESRRKESDREKIAEKESPSYNNLFDSDEYEPGDKKESQEEFDQNRINEDFRDESKHQETFKVQELGEERENDNNTISRDIESDDDTNLDNKSDNMTRTTYKSLNSISDMEIPTIKTTNEKSRDKRRPSCNLLKLRQLNFNSPRTLPEIIAQLKQWAEDSPLAKWVDITEGNLTTMENPIYLMMIDDPTSGQIVTAKQTVVIVAGIQGRDHHAVAAAMYILYQLIERSEVHADLLSKYRFWVVPVFNPDGYDYSMTFPHRRDWAKNLHHTWDACKGRESCRACEIYGIRCTVQSCYGVNLDRNFEYQWIPAEELRAKHACGALFAGERQLSEPETQALTHFLHSLRMPLFTFIAFKEGDVLGIMYPYSHTRKKRAFDHIYRQRASRAASAAYSIAGRPYVAGQTSEFLPLYAGGIEDWIDGHLGIDNTYTIMMFRPSDSYNTNLITERVVHEAYVAMDTLLLQSLEPLGPPPHTMTRSGSGTGSMMVSSMLISVSIIAILILTISC